MADVRWSIPQASEYACVNICAAICRSVPLGSPNTGVPMSSPTMVRRILWIFENPEREAHDRRHREDGE